MTRPTLVALLAASLAGPWAGCERDPVTPPATPPTERAPANPAAPAEPRSGGDTMLVPATRRLG